MYFPGSEREPTPPPDLTQDLFGVLTSLKGPSGRPIDEDSPHRKLIVDAILFGFFRLLTCTIVGTHANCHLGTSSPEDPTEHRIIGKHSAPSQRPNCITPDLLNILRANDLLAPTTYFRHKSYSTTHAGNGFASEPRQIDYFFASQNLKKVILDARSIGNGVDSDHTALKLKLGIPFKKFRVNREPRRFKAKLNWRLLATDERKASAFTSKVDEILPPNSDITEFNSTLLAAAHSTIATKSRKRPDWWSGSERKLQTAIAIRNNDFEIWKNDQTDDTLKRLRASRRKLD